MDAATGAGLEAVVQMGDEAYVTDSFGELIWTSEGALPAEITIHLMGYHHQVVEIEEVRRRTLSVSYGITRLGC